MTEMDKIWGYTEGDCAWCLDKPATKEYIGDQPSDMGKALYQVCQNCYEERGRVMNTPTITQELDWCEVELANIKAGLFSMYTQDYIEGAISALKLAQGGE